MALARDRSFGGTIHTDATLLAGAVALLGACVLTPTAVADGPVVCPFRLATGLPCPACGSVRAWTAFAHGDVAGAVAHNPFAVVVLLATVAALAWRLTAHMRPDLRGPDLERIARSPVTLAFMGIWVAWGIIRAAGM